MKSNEPIDILLPLGNGSKHQDLELRMALRSIRRHALGVRHVWIVGHVPAWLREDDRVRLAHRREFRGPKASRIALKVQWAFEHLDLTECVAFWNDDYILLKDYDIRSIPDYYRGDLWRTGPSGWHQLLRSTHQALREAGLLTRHYDIHVPIIYQRQKFLELTAWWSRGLVAKSVYGNHHCNAVAQTTRDCKLQAGWRERIDRVARQRWVLSYGDGALRTGFGDWLQERFSLPTAAERDRVTSTVSLPARSPRVLRTLPGGTYISTAQLLADTLNLRTQLPEDTAAVVGVARSGMLPASLLACHLHRPLYSVSADGVRDCGRGARLRGALPLGPIVLIDDTVYNGLQMRQREELVRQHFGKQSIIRCAVYSTPPGAGAVDLISALLPPPHYLEWNLANSGYLATTAWDLDGIIVTNHTALPLYTPRSAPVRMIITARPGTERETTIRHLRRLGVTLQELVMWPGSAKDREAILQADPEAVARWKARVYRNSKCQLYVESEPGLARAIARISQLPVLCPVAGQVFSSQENAA
jgi:orotate phosphoribosyltransferase